MNIQSNQLNFGSGSLTKEGYAKIQEGKSTWPADEVLKNLESAENSKVNDLVYDGSRYYLKDKQTGEMLGVGNPACIDFDDKSFTCNMRTPNNEVVRKTYNLDPREIPKVAHEFRAGGFLQQSTMALFNAIEATNNYQKTVDNLKKYVSE